MMCQTVCSETIYKIRAYLKGEIGEDEVSDWALGVIRSSAWGSLPQPVSRAIHVLFDLHDHGAPWQPDREELRKCLAELEKKDFKGED